MEARLVAHLAEVEARRLHLVIGCSSLYDYCRKRLGLSDYEAFVRIAAARVARECPVVFGMLERRELHLTAICEVRDFLTTENHHQLRAPTSRRAAENSGSRIGWPRRAARGARHALAYSPNEYSKR